MNTMQCELLIYTACHFERVTRVCKTGGSASINVIVLRPMLRTLQYDTLEPCQNNPKLAQLARYYVQGCSFIGAWLLLAWLQYAVT